MPYGPSPRAAAWTSPSTRATWRPAPRPGGRRAAAYFTVAEALTNAAQHSSSHRASVQLTYAARDLTVSDDGHVEADETTGSGLLGMRRQSLPSTAPYA